MIASPWIASVLGLWAAYWAAMFAQVAYLRAQDDGVGAIAFSRLSRTFLVIAVGLFLMVKGA